MINIKRLLFVFAFFTCFFISETIIAQKINQFDVNKKRTGVWQKKYPNNRIRYSGTFKNGKEIGIFKFYANSSSQHPTIIKTYSNNKETVLVEFFKTNGILESKGYFLNKKRVGQWTYYFKDGKIMSEEFYTNGKLEGKMTNFYPNGKEAEISNYRNGLKDGTSKKFSSKGVLIEEVTFRNGKPNGIAKYFELNGNLKEEGMYKDGKREGKWEFYLDGEIASDEDIKHKKSTFAKKKGN